ncbi:MAG: 30S ribosomal protein S7 [Candidatus Diapherotrites archaeon]|nr:30S ribosomal protein S7 [Candidatus Diapherotrites archaeon]
MEPAVESKKEAKGKEAVEQLAEENKEAKPGETRHKEPKQTGDTFAEPLIFGKWGTEDVTINDASLARYVNLKTKHIPHTFGRTVTKRFEKANISIVERLINKVMRSGQGKRKLSGKYIRGRGSCGKKLQSMHIVEKALEIVEAETKQNPIQVLIRAIENSAPREDVTRIKRGGIMYTQAVDVAPMKRVDEALKNIALAAFSGSFNNKKKAEEALAEEIILASKEESKSFSVKRRDEVERIAKSSR